MFISVLAGKTRGYKNICIVGLTDTLGPVTGIGVLRLPPTPWQLAPRHIADMVADDAVT